MDIVDLDTSINLFLKDGIDIMNVMRYNEYHQLQQAGIDIEDLFTVSFADIGLNVADNGLYTTREFYEKHSKHCRDFVDATIEGWLYAINNQEETISTVLEIMHKHHLPANRPHQKWMLNELSQDFMVDSSQIGVLQKSQFEEAKRLLTEQNMPITSQTYNSFYPYAK
jgi:NitT/TauT family transport system substrate-binding protein